MAFRQLEVRAMIEVLVVLLVAVVVFVVAVSIVKQSGSKEENDFVYDTSDGELHPHKWGYTDTRFEFESPTRIRLTGTRYLLAGYSMPYFIPFVEEMLQVPVNPDEMVIEEEDCDVPSSLADPALVASFREILDDERVSLDDQDRLVHSHGSLSRERRGGSCKRASRGGTQSVPGAFWWGHQCQRCIGIAQSRQPSIRFG